MERYNGLLEWLKAHPAPPMNLPLPADLSHSLLDLAMQPDLQRQPCLPLFLTGSPLAALVDKIPSSMGRPLSLEPVWLFHVPLHKGGLGVARLSSEVGDGEGQQQQVKKARHSDHNDPEAHLTIKHF